MIIYFLSWLFFSNYSSSYISACSLPLFLFSSCIRQLHPSYNIMFILCFGFILHYTGFSLVQIAVLYFLCIFVVWTYIILNSIQHSPSDFSPRMTINSQSMVTLYHRRHRNIIKLIIGSVATLAGMSGVNRHLHTIVIISIRKLFERNSLVAGWLVRG